MECNACGLNFAATKEGHYIAREKEGKGFSSLSGMEATIFDAFDCPRCGCQIIVQERKRQIKEEAVAYEVTEVVEET
jgi:DNA-directed RNA polymerase subunit RPC12/RpoP